MNNKIPFHYDVSDWKEVKETIISYRTFLESKKTYHKYVSLKQDRYRKRIREVS